MPQNVNIKPDNVHSDVHKSAPAVVVQRRHKLTPGECSFCDELRGVNFHPSHDPSRYCESGKHPHCTCDACF